jgi:hypothetical protein
VHYLLPKDQLHHSPIAMFYHWTEVRACSNQHIGSISSRILSIVKRLRPVPPYVEVAGCLGYQKAKEELIKCGLIFKTRQGGLNANADLFAMTWLDISNFLHDRPDAKTVMAQLDRWFEDYNEFHPNKGLKMKSPRQFIRSQLLITSCPV